MALLPVGIGVSMCGAKTGLLVPMRDAVARPDDVRTDVRNDHQDAPSDVVDRDVSADILVVDSGDVDAGNDDAGWCRALLGSSTSCPDAFMCERCPAGETCFGSTGKGGAITCESRTAADASTCGAIQCGSGCTCQSVAESTCACYYGIGPLPPPDLPA